MFALAFQLSELNFTFKSDIARQSSVAEYSIHIEDTEPDPTCTYVGNIELFNFGESETTFIYNPPFCKCEDGTVFIPYVNLTYLGTDPQVDPLIVILQDLCLR